MATSQAQEGLVQCQAAVNIQSDELRQTFVQRTTKLFRKWQNERRSHRRTWREFRAVVRELRHALDERRDLVDQVRELEHEVNELRCALVKCKGAQNVNL
jgi:uncharacterized coiled-coil DUF342 family protein